MKNLRPSDFPLKETSPFSPTLHLYISKPDNSLLYSVHDITNPNAAKQITASKPPDFEIRQKSRISRVFTCKEPTGLQAAEITGKLLSFGHWRLSFPAGSAHSAHDIEMRPVGTGSKADIFIQDSVPYFWDMEGTNRRLFKVVENRRVEVARLTRKHSRDSGGVLAIGDGEVDIIVALMTSIAVLKRNDSFRAG